MLPKTKLNTIEVLISKALIDSNISFIEFVSVNNVLKEYVDMKQKIKNPSKWKFKLYIKQCCLIVWSAEKILKVKPKRCKNKKRKNNALTKLCSLW